MSRRFSFLVIVAATTMSWLCLPASAHGAEDSAAETRSEEPSTDAIAEVHPRPASQAEDAKEVPPVPRFEIEGAPAPHSSVGGATRGEPPTPTE
jgi:hypothetical protein